jgi:hypothetical protein
MKSNQRRDSVELADSGVVEYGSLSPYHSLVLDCDLAQEKPRAPQIPSGGGVVRNMVATPDRRLYLACSGVNKVAFVDLNRLQVTVDHLRTQKDLVSDQLSHASLRARALLECPKIPAEGSDTPGPSAALLCWSRSGGARGIVIGRTRRTQRPLDESQAGA